MGLLACLAAFYAVAVGLRAGLNAADGAGVPLAAQAVGLACLAAGLCRVRD